MSKESLSGCLTTKQIVQLNDKFPQLPFELGCLLDEIFLKIITLAEDFELCEASDVPQDTGGEQQFLCIVDGKCIYVPKQEVVDAYETVTVIAYDSTNHTITYTDEEGNETVLQLNCATIGLDPALCELKYTDEKGVETVLDLSFLDVAPPVFDPADCSLTYTSAKGVESVVDLSSMTQTSLTFDAPTRILSFTDPKGNVTELDIAVIDQTDPSFDPVTCELVFTNSQGVETRVAITNIATGYGDTTVPTTDFVNYLGHNSDGKVVPVPLPDNIDVKCVTLCDVGNDNKPYILEVTNNITTSTKTTATFELDGVTVYTPVEAGLYKPKAKEMKKVYVIDLSGDNGVTEDYWEASALGEGAPLSAEFPAIEEIFTEEDQCGVLDHVNDPDTTSVLATFTSTDPAGTAVPHQSRVETYIVIPEGGKYVRLNTLGQASGALYLAPCSDKLKRVGTSLNKVSGTFSMYEGFLPQGIYHAVAFVHDGGSTGRLSGQWSDTGTSYQNIPAAALYQVQPKVVPVCVWLEDGDATYYNTDGTELDLTDKEVAICDPCDNKVEGFEADAPVCFADTVWCIDADAPKGVTEKYWDQDGTAVPGTASQTMPPTIPNIFTERDACNYPVHVNDAAPDAVNILTTFDTTDPQTANFVHQNEITAYVYVPEDGTELLTQAGGASSNMTFIGVCNGKLGLVSESAGANSGTNSAGIYARGIYCLKAFVHDPGTFGRTEIRWRLPGGSVTDIPLDNLFIDMPSIVCKKVLITKGQQEKTELNGEPLAENLICFDCNPCENVAPIATGGLIEPAKSEVIGNERVTVDSGAATTAPLTIPTGANGAIVQVLIDDPDQREGCVNYYANGANATAANGYQAGHKDFIYLGCKSSNGVSTDLGSELTNFDFHTAEVTSGDVSLEVTYYSC